jgi:hypothetical protein
MLFVLGSRYGHVLSFSTSKIKPIFELLVVLFSALVLQEQSFSVNHFDTEKLVT